MPLSNAKSPFKPINQIRVRKTFQRRSAPQRKVNPARLGFESLEARALLSVAPEWLMTVGGDTTSGNRTANAAVHPSGDVYFTADFDVTVDFDPGPGEVKLAPFGADKPGFPDVAIARYTATGDLVWAKRIGGGPNGHTAVSLSLDRLGNAYVSSEYRNETVDVGGQQYTTVDGTDGFVTKLDDAGNFVWTRQFALGGGVSGIRLLSGLAVDDRDVNPANWSVFVSGYFTGAGQFGSQQFNAGPARDAFISRLDASTGGFISTQTISGKDNQFAFGLALAKNGDVGLYVSGSTDTTAKIGTATLSSGNYIAKLNPDTGATLWTRKVAVASINVAANGASVVASGGLVGTVDFDPGPGVVNLTSAGGQDAALLKLDSTGNFVWARRIGGSGDEYLQALALSGAGNVYAAGPFSSAADFGGQVLTPIGTDGYLAQLDGAGTFGDAYAFPDQAWGVAADPLENVYVASSVGGSDTSPMKSFPTGDRLGNKGWGLSLLKFSPNPPPIDPAPRIDRFTSAPTSVLGGDVATLRVNRVHDPDARFHTVKFYRDNGDQVLDGSDVLVGVDANSNGGWTTAVSTAGLATGTYTFFAEGTDIDGVVLDVTMVAVTVQEIELASYASTAVPVPIRDLATVTSTMTVPDSFAVLDLDVELTITHTCDGDLDVFLIGPSGTRVQLFADLLNCDDNFTGTILDDEATSALSNGGAPYSGRFRPQGRLSTFDGIDATGTWTLEITDDARRGTGTLNSWSLTFSRAVVPALAPLAASAAGAVVARVDQVFQHLAEDSAALLGLPAVSQRLGTATRQLSASGNLAAESSRHSRRLEGIVRRASQGEAHMMTDGDRLSALVAHRGEPAAMQRALGKQFDEVN